MNARIDNEQLFEQTDRIDPLPPITQASASLVRADSPLSVRGNVDVISLEQGIEGWVVDLAAPQMPLRLQLLAGDQLIAEAATGLSRADVVSLLGAPAAPGFRFSAQVLAELDEVLAQLPLRVVIADEPVEIVAGTALPSVAALMNVEPPELLGFDLMDRLGALRQAGAPLSALPLRPGAWKEVGCIETLSIDEGGLVWVQGWMRRCAAIDSAAAVVDGRKEAAGFVYTWFERADLDGDHCGFVGLIHSSWRPTSATTPLVFIKTDDIVYLRGLAPTRIIKHGEFVAAFRKLSNRCHTGPTAELLRFFDSPSGWTPTETGALAALDSAYFIPGFGCIVSGWAINPLSSPLRFALRFGASILTSDDDSLVFSPRTDLENIAAGCDALLQRAGFVAAFRGDLASREIDTPLLKITYEDGTSSRHTIDRGLFRTIGSAADPEVLLQRYPALSREQFFPDLARALRASDRAQASAWRPVKLSPCPHAIVCVLSDNRPGLYLLIEQLRAHAVQRGSAGVILIADPTAIRSDAIALRASLQEDAGIPCSLISSRRSGQALYALDSMLKAVGCERFVFLGPGVFLSQSGWSSAFEYLASDEPAGCFLGLTDPAMDEPDSHHSAAAFAWTRQALARWLVDAPSFLGGYAFDNGLAAMGFKQIAQGAWFTCDLNGSAFVQAINRVGR